jgi:hypothetical protein
MLGQLRAELDAAGTPIRRPLAALLAGASVVRMTLAAILAASAFKIWSKDA